jgi:hypothetical protein
MAVTGSVQVIVRVSIAGQFDSFGVKARYLLLSDSCDRLCGLVVRVLGYSSGGPGSIPDTTRIKKVVGLERVPLSLVSTTEELLDRKVAAPSRKPIIRP